MCEIILVNCNVGLNSFVWFCDFRRFIGIVFVNFIVYFSYYYIVFLGFFYFNIESFGVVIENKRLVEGVLEVEINCYTDELGGFSGEKT